jgi:hypothetical protein
MRPWVQCLVPLKFKERERERKEKMFSVVSFVFSNEKTFISAIQDSNLNV